jgi:hypothetical protein
MGLGRFPREELGRGRRWAQVLFPGRWRQGEGGLVGGDDLAQDEGDPWESGTGIWNNR